jgi:PKD repeat protein
MRMGLNRFAALLLATSLIFVLSDPTEALSMRAANWQQIRGAADIVVSGTVETLRYEETSEPHAGGVQTRMTLSETRVLTQREGGVAPTQFSVVLPGGLRKDGARVMLPGAPEFTPGERVVLFLRQSDADYALVGHGMGVMRRSTDGLWIVPDMPITDGPTATGEKYEQFVARLGSTIVVPTLESQAAVQTNGLKIGAVIFFALALLAIVLLRRRAAKVAALLVGAVALASMAAMSAPVAASAGSRAFKLAGPKWDLSKFVRGRVEGGKILWLKGRGTPDLSDDVVFSTIQTQFQRWEDLPDSSVAFRRAGDTIEAGATIDERNVVSFLEKVPKKIFDEFTLAVTFLIFTDASGRFIDTDIVFNDVDVTWSLDGSNIALDVVALHEIGHLIGLDHTDDPADVMFPTARGVRTFSSGDIEGARTLYPIDVAQPPVATASASPAIGNAPLPVAFSSADSFSRTGAAITYSWDFGDGSAVSTEASPVHTYTAPGTYTAALTVTDTANSITATSTVTIIVGGVSAASELTLKKFVAQVALAASLRDLRSKDKLSITLGGVDVAAGDKVTLNLGAISIGTGINAIPLDARVGFKGNSDVGGTVAAKYKAKARELTVSLANTSFGIALDPRQPTDTSQSGSGSFPVMLLIIKTDGTRVVQSGTVTFTYVIKSGNVPNGFAEKTLTLKL